jgi:predicted  nucleic acid-binding Zn-ribbon protein
MSHSVVIDYQAIAIECRSICEVAAKQLCKIDSFLQKIDENSSSLLGYETDRMKQSLQQQAVTIKRQIDEIIRQSEETGKKGTVKAETAGNSRSIVNIAQSLQNQVNTFATEGIANYESLLDSLLHDKIRQQRQRAIGMPIFDKEFAEQLDQITDEALRGFIYFEWLDPQNSRKSFRKLKEIAETKLQNGVENYFKQEKKKLLQDIETEMREAKLDEATIQNALRTNATNEKEQITEIRQKATAEIVGESIRKKTLKVVLECIEKQGFIVDRKNIKLQRDKNEVVMIAQKASGEWAEFKIMLDGKFIYRFDGYEGQACQNDIQPFMRDLEEIYGVKIKEQQEIWSNPDKLSFQKYQQINTKTINN